MAGPVIERDSTTWRAVKAWAVKRVAASHEILSTPGLPIEPTEFERGRIAAAQELLAEGDPRPKVQAEAAPPGAALIW